MSENRNHLAGIIFGVASIAMFIMVVLYLFVYQPPSGALEARMEYMQNNWLLIATIWRVEFLIAILIAWVSFYFSRQNWWWYLVAIGHVLMLLEYAVMLGGYTNAADAATYNLLNEIAVWIFGASNFIWLAGITGVYSSHSGWLKFAGGILATIAGLLFLAVVAGLLSMSQVVIMGPFVLILYLLNGYLGLKVLASRKLAV